MALDTSNIKVGNARLFWDTPGTEIDLGLTREGSVLAIEQGGAEIITEEFGIAPVEFVYGGVKATVRVTFMENKNDVLLVMFPGSTQTAGPTRRQWKFGEEAGVAASSIAKQLRLHPQTVTPLSNTDDDVVIYKACPLSIVEVGINSRGAREWAASFLALIDTVTDATNPLGRWKTDAV